jgi:hypothetical protein
MNKTKKLLAISLTLSAFAAEARDQYVKGYARKDGTYVEGHYRTQANKTQDDNYSSYGNSNPYTGEEGRRVPQSSPYSQYWNNQDKED